VGSGIPDTFEDTGQFLRRPDPVLTGILTAAVPVTVIRLTMLE
jgi:hypothetical protein